MSITGNMIMNMSDFFFKTKLLGRRLPLLASFKLTYRCNLRCNGCPFHQRAGEKGSHIDWETATDSLDSLHEMGCKIVVFEGGEPLLWTSDGHDFSDLANYANSRFMCVAATTNGTVDLNVPTKILWVSMDGTKNTHDHLRSDSFDTIEANIKNSLHEKLFVHCTINRDNADDIENLTRYISEIPQIKGITFQLFYPYDQGEDHLALSHEQRENALKTVMKLKLKGYKVMNSFWSLYSMIDNTWKCREWLLANVDPDGEISTGCYVSKRGEVRCEHCGFTPVSEASGAYAFIPGSILAGIRIFS